MDEVLKAFPTERIFSVNATSFIEWDISQNEWLPVQYGDIVPLERKIQEGAEVQVMAPDPLPRSR